MKTLYLMRHAEALSGDDDFERPLSPKGRMDVLKLHDFFKERRPKIIRASSARRTMQTAILMFNDGISSDRTLYLASAADLKQEIALADDAHDSLLILAHNPGIADLALALSGQLVNVTPGTFMMIESTAESWALINADNCRLLKTLSP